MKKQITFTFVVLLGILIVGCVLTVLIRHDSVGLTDGSFVKFYGTFRDASIVDGHKTFNATTLGLSLRYPEEYVLFEKETSVGNSIILLPRDRALSFISDTPSNTELPPSISLDAHNAPATAVTAGEDWLEQWIRTHPAESNFNLSDGAQDGILTRTTVAGAPAFSYHSPGLYDTQYVVFRHGYWVIVATVARETQESAVKDFESIMSSIAFLPEVR